MSTTVVKTTLRVDDGLRATPAEVRRPPGAAWLWAFVGLATVALMCRTWLPWLTSSDTHQPSPGGDHYAYMWALRGTEVISVSVFLGLGYHALLRPLRSGRGLTFDGKVFIAAFLVSSLDVLYASLNPTWAMNAHAVSLGTWSEHMPGYANPGQDANAWGLLWCLPAYIWLGLGAALAGTAILGALRRRFPRMSTVALYVTTLSVFYVVFAVIENFWLRTHVYDYVSVPSALTLWAGKVHQFPVYSPLLIAAYCLGYTWLRDSRDADDRCAVDRDVDALNIGRRTKGLVSVLAITGYAAAVTVFGYQIPWAVMSMKGDSFPVLPSYLQPGEICGQPGKPLCASQYLHELREHPQRLPTVKPIDR
jgi:hypothetical protein